MREAAPPFIICKILSLNSAVINLLCESVQASGTADEIGALVTSMWERHSDAEPDADIARIYPFIRERR